MLKQDQEQFYYIKSYLVSSSFVKNNDLPRKGMAPRTGLCDHYLSVISKSAYKSTHDVA